MILRREFLQLGATVGMGTVLSWPDADDVSDLLPPFLARELATEPVRAALPLLAVLVDERRWDESIRLSGELSRRLPVWAPDQVGATMPVNGDVSRFCRERLLPAWEKDRWAVAGVTGPDVLFCMEQLARDQQLRVRHREVIPQQQGEPLIAWYITA